MIDLVLEYSEASATIIVGVVGFWWHSSQSRSFMKRQQTFNIVVNAQMDDVFQKRMKHVRRYFADYDKKDKLNPNKFDETFHDDDLRAVLNFFEAMGASVHQGDLDESLLYQTYRGIVVKVYGTFEDHIHAHRKNKKSVKAFEHLQWLNDRWEQNPPRKIRIKQWCKGLFH